MYYFCYTRRKSVSEKRYAKPYFGYSCARPWGGGQTLLFRNLIITIPQIYHFTVEVYSIKFTILGVTGVPTTRVYGAQKCFFNF